MAAVCAYRSCCCSWAARGEWNLKKTCMAYVWNLLSCLEKVWCCMRDETFSEHGNEKDRNKEHQDYCNEKNLHWKLNPASTVYDRGCVGWCGVLLLGWERETSFVIKTPVALANGESNRSLTPAEPILCCAGTQIASGVYLLVVEVLRFVARGPTQKPNRVFWKLFPVCCLLPGDKAKRRILKQQQGGESHYETYLGRPDAYFGCPFLCRTKKSCFFLLAIKFATGSERRRHIFPGIWIRDDEKRTKINLKSCT